MSCVINMSVIVGKNILNTKQSAAIFAQKLLNTHLWHCVKVDSRGFD
ncbi:hypothetical protein [Helicobacter canis]|nr:hypothetical protein [Helicobacter canis]